MAIYMRDKHSFKIISRTEPHEIIDYYFEQLEEAMSYYDIGEDPDMLQAWLHMRTSILFWQQYWAEEEN
jgi:hypothetical protein